MTVAVCFFSAGTTSAAGPAMFIAVERVLQASLALLGWKGYSTVRVGELQ